LHKQEGTITLSLIDKDGNYCSNQIAMSAENRKVYGPLPFTGLDNFTTRKLIPFNIKDNENTRTVVLNKVVL
jgi:hypothetical protein